ncbi:transmembrane protein, putative [Actinidia rufa]|uniref:Transmembrane protein, putative n=1 Tax=Actinidia rufa TaxID=165716 RepID=A0A7J0H8V9_9ERIC|nr:transmembrane protein, putative [Actinidia rufa]
MSSPALLSMLLLITLSSAAAAAEATTAYELLKEYDFPEGLLPLGVTGYELDASTGKFKVYLNGTCSFKAEGYELKYKSKISGVISKDKIKKLNGISVKVIFLWFDITEVTRDGDDLNLSVGIASAQFGIDNFEESPQCGCGFDCVNGEREENVELRINRFVSSSILE